MAPRERTLSPESPRARSTHRGTELKHAAHELLAIRVSKTSSTRGVSGAVAHLARERRDMPILAGSAKALCTAIKSVAAARTLLREDAVDAGLAATTERDAGERSVTRLQLITTTEKHPNVADGASYTVSKNTNPAALAGALAARLREGKSALASCVGVDAALRAATAVALATGYYGAGEEASGGDGRVLAFPFFTSEGEGDDTITVLNLLVKLA
jgi:stage V sporulation protein SpoVS